MSKRLPLTQAKANKEEHRSDLNAPPTRFPYQTPVEITKERRVFFAVLAVFFILLAATIWFTLPNNKAQPLHFTLQQDNDHQTSEAILPIPLVNQLDEKKVSLGERLFSDPRLSADNSIACIHCHNLQRGGADSAVASRGINNQLGDINSPTVFNSAFNFTFFWDGRATTLEEQIDGPIHHKKEMASSWAEVIKKLKQDSDFLKQFTNIYSDGLTPDNIKSAIAEFERSLTTPNSRFDRHLRGETGIINKDEKLGYELFKDYGCISCHQGINVGGNMFQVFGVMGNYFSDRGNITIADYGRFNVTKKEKDRHHFRVPSLRNVALTAPYFHDGSAKSLKDAVKVMAKYQLGREIPDKDIEKIIAFLKTLTGEYKGLPL